VVAGALRQNPSRGGRLSARPRLRSAARPARARQQLWPIRRRVALL